MKTQWNMRLEKEELEKWKERAAQDGKLPSEWLRDLANGQCIDKPEPAAVRAAIPGIGVTVCVECTHKKSRHGGFGGCCQEDNCLCVGFKGE